MKGELIVIKKSRKILLLCLLLILICSSCKKAIIDTKNSDITYPTNQSTPTAIQEQLSPTPTSVPSEQLELQDVQYDEVSFQDMYTINYSENKGIAIDLNGDSQKELIFVDKIGVYINGTLYQDVIGHTNYLYEGYKTWWLLDIDKDDQLFELLFINVLGEFVVYHFTDSFQLVGNFNNYHTDKDIRYASFSENKNISFEYMANVLERTLQELTFCLDADGKLTVVPGNYEINYDCTLQLLKEIVLFSEKDLKSDFCTVNPQMLTLKKTDGCNWTYVVADDGSKGWIYTEKNSSNLNGDEKYIGDYFSGFNTAG